MRIKFDFDELGNIISDATSAATQLAPLVSIFNPGVGMALGTLQKLNATVDKAKKGDPTAIQMVKAIKDRSATGDPRAIQAVATMAVVSKAQDVKASKLGASFYQRGLSIGHDFVALGAVRDQRGGAGGGGGVRVTDVARNRALSNARGKARTPGAVTDQRGGKSTTYYTPPASGTSPFTQFQNGKVAAPPFVLNPGGKPMEVYNPPVQTSSQTPPQDPYAQYPGYPGYPQYPQYPGYQDPYAQYPGYQDPYAQYPGYQDPYAQYPGYMDPYAQYGYPLPGLPPGYGYEEPIIDHGGFQQYDPATDSFYSSSQKQVYDEETGIFYPAF